MAIGPQSKPTDTSPVSAFDVKKKALEIKKTFAHKKTTNPKPKVNFDLSRNIIVSYDPKAVALAQPLNSQSKSSAIERANEIQASLPSELPSFVKLMLPSHVTRCFWLGLPKSFCDAHLLKDDVTVVLVGEGDQEYNTKYLDCKTGLSGGWRGFSMAHKLLAGDVLVFQLIEQWKMKVYIVRASGLNEIDGALGLLNLVPCDMNGYQHQNSKDASNLQRAENMDIDLHQDNDQDNGLIMYDQSVDDTEYADSQVSEGLRFSQSVIEFKDIKGVDDFSIVVDNLVIDSEIPKHFQIKYYDLCRSQNMYLHEDLLKGLNVKLAVGIILKTVTIADAIRACKVTITRDDIATWDKTLKAFEEIGMKVGFLRARISKLKGLLFESNELLEAKRIEQMHAEEEMRLIKEKQNLEPVFHKTYLYRLPGFLLVHLGRIFPAYNIPSPI
ncbi:B3 DNA binding domain-containing protein [Tanacetum coccineum]